MTQTLASVPPVTETRRRRSGAGGVNRRPGIPTYGLLLAVILGSAFPLYWSFLVGSYDATVVNKDLPPICLITGDRRIEWPCRVEENELLFATLRNFKHPYVEFHELKDLDHGTVPQGAAKVMPEFISRLAKPAGPARCSAVAQATSWARGC